jgi:hypothetical protein
MIIDDWEPVTSDMGLIQAPLGRLRAAFLEWQAGLGQVHEEWQIKSGLADALERLAPLSAGEKRRLFIETRSGWTAQFQSGIQGSDPFPVMSLFAQKLGVLAMRICSAPLSKMYPATIWEVYAPPHLGGGTLGYRRSVCAANDGGRWIFEASGEPYPFEELDKYELGRKRDRFTREMLIRYLEHFSLRPFEDEFYVVDAERPALLLQRPRWQTEPSEFSLEQVKAGAPWKR